MAVVSALSPLSLTCFFYDSGELVRPARLFFYKPNTEDAVTVYTDPTLGVPYGQPVLSGGSGRVPPIYIGTEPYRVRIYDTYGALIEDIEFLPGAAAVSEGGDGGDAAVPGTVLQTGDMFHAFANATTQRTGCVRANGGIIGSVGFDTTPYPGQAERLNADTHDLFVWLWGQDDAAVNALAILPSGRGTSAESDWASNKGIRLPDLRGRALVGLDSMGQAATLRLLGVDITPVVPDLTAYNWSGITGGAAMMVQTAAQMPNHTHTVLNAPTGIAIYPNPTGITIQSSTTGITASGLAYTYAGVISDDVGPFGLSPGADYTYNPAITVTPNTTLFDPGHIHGVSDPWHAHSVADPTHWHNLGTAGSGALMQTITPFSLAVVYIKL